MPPSSPPDEPPIRPAHPLALRLAERLRPGGRVLEFGTGNGRNAAVLTAAGFDVTRIDDGAAERDEPLPSVPGGYAAVISTHGLLHGSTGQIAARVDALCAALDRGGFFYAVFGSTHDGRFGRGTRLESRTFAPVDGDERGVAHTFFVREEVEALLAPFVTLEHLEERSADDVAGTWAHPTRPLAGAVHWFAAAVKR